MRKGTVAAASKGCVPWAAQKRGCRGLPDDFDEVMGQAVQLKREAPKRGVRRIIKILEPSEVVN